MRKVDRQTIIVVAITAAFIVGVPAAVIISWKIR